jgi:prepilin-type N-terminal cleavage/methylation domain-containing protein
LRDQSGFTLVELLVAIALASVVFGATLTVLDVFQSGARIDQQRNENQDSARSAVDRLARQLRNVVSPSTEKAGALLQAQPYTVAFQTIDSSKAPAGENTTGAELVRYCLDDSIPSSEILWQQVKRWTSAKAPALPEATTCPDLTAGDWDASAQLVQHVTNRSGGQNRALFVYGPAGWTNAAQIVSIETNLFLEINPGHRPGETQLTSGVSLRNTNREPTAAFSATEVNGHVRLNASESHDPGDLALTYQWWMDSVKQSTTSQQWETETLASKTTHTFKLEVTNPGGLSNSTERKVTMQ